METMVRIHYAAILSERKILTPYFLNHLNKDENALIMTIDGEVEHTYSRRGNQDFLKNGDTIQELMTKIMKKPKAKEGKWLWRISKNWKAVSGWQL